MKYLLLFLIFVTSVFGEALPKPANYFNDYANTVSAEQARELNDKLIQLEKTTTAQVVVVIMDTLAGRPIEEFAHENARAWKVGQGGKNNGAVLFFFRSEKRMRLEVGYGLEGALPDIVAKSILVDTIKPFTKDNKYYEGAKAGIVRISAIIQKESGEQKTKLQDAKVETSGTFWIWVIVIIVFIIIIICISSPNGASVIGDIFCGLISCVGSVASAGFSGGGGDFGGGGASD